LHKPLIVGLGADHFREVNHIADCFSARPENSGHSRLSELAAPCTSSKYWPKNPLFPSLASGAGFASTDGGPTSAR
jgi:hypothetical protein